MTNHEPISNDIINLVIARLESMPRNVEVSIGGLNNIGASYSIDQLIESVRNQDVVGRKMIDVQLSYLRNLSKLSVPA